MVRADGSEIATFHRPPSLTPRPWAVCMERCVTDPKPSATASSTGLVRRTWERGLPASRPTQYSCAVFGGSTSSGMTSWITSG